MSIFGILGGLGVFLFGMRIMSGGLQKLAGNRLRAILGGMTRNRFTGVLSGFTITCAAQSSSATTVLVVSFANAGLLSLTQAMGLVMGANIGTTITAWIVAALGFKIKISAFALPIIGIGFPLSLINSTRARQLSEVLVGFGLLFMGLKFLKDGVPDLKSDPAAFEFLQQLTHYGFGSLLLFVIVGTVLTVVVQSSSAASAITLTMVAKGWIDFDLAAAMVLGENIGTTITAQLAAIGATRNARRVAHFHTLFNVIGVLWMLPVMPVVLSVLESAIDSGPARVAAFHSAFNIANTVLLIGLVNYLQRIVLWLVPLRGGEGEVGHLQFLESGLLGTPELASIEARRAIGEMVHTCDTMFGDVKEVLANPHKPLGKVVDQVKRGEQQTDEMEEEIINFCSELARSGTSITVGRDVARNLELANDIERIGDHCVNLILLAERRWGKKYEFPEDTQARLNEMMDCVGSFLRCAYEAAMPNGDVDMAEAKLLEGKINKMRNATRKSHADRMQAGEIDVRAGLIFLDMMTNLEKIGDYCWNVVKALDEQESERARHR